MIKVISFDIDGTLVDYQYADLVWCEGIPKLYLQKNKITFEEAKKFVLSEYMKIGERKIEWYDIKYWFKRFGLEGWEKLLREYEDKIRIYQDAESTLKSLSKSYKIVAASNAAREFIELTTKALKKYLSAIFSSTSDFKLVKKTPEFYSKLLENLGIEKQALLHVGDHYEFDYLVPKKLGIKALCLDRTGSKSGEDVIRSLKEVIVRLSLG